MITIETLKTEQTRLAAMIAELEARATAPASSHFPEALIELRDGEHYAGLVVGKDGEPSHHLILLPGEAEEITWAKAKDWADKQGGEYVATLPTRREQALLYANLKEQFQPQWYWSGEQPAADSGCAWYQYFDNGGQHYYDTHNTLRARAVRRLIIE